VALPTLSTRKPSGLTVGVARHVRAPRTDATNMPVQTTLILLKPDCVQRGLTAEVLARFERKGLRLAGLKFLIPTKAQAEAHYAEHAGKPFFPSLLGFITSSPLVAIALRGDSAIAVARTLIGPTDGRAAPPGTIRGDFDLSKSNNLVHGSDSEAAAERELKIWFAEGLVDWTKADVSWVETP
jgi:nucleoside-diphosphate kinase